MVTRRRLALVLVLVAAALAVAVAVAWALGLVFTDTARPAPAGSAVMRFRVLDPHPAAIDGVYTYRTRGGESLDVLGGKRHRYPATTTITVVSKSPCVQLRWDALAGRSTTWTLCRRSGSVVLQGLDEVHTFFGQTDRTRYACAPAAGGFRCTTAHGGERGREALAGAAQLEVGGVRVRTIRVRMSATVVGESHGVETAEWWLDPRTALPLELVVSSRTSRSEPIVGDAHYREDATLRLVSTTPQR